MKEITVGEYVRTIDGKIDKVIEISGKYILLKNNFKITEFMENRVYFKIKDIVKHSPNIIDLIEKSDIVEVLDNWSGNKQIIYIYDDSDISELKLDIKNGFLKLLSITTEAQFNQVKYEV